MSVTVFVAEDDTRKLAYKAGKFRIISRLKKVRRVLPVGHNEFIYVPRTRK